MSGLAARIDLPPGKRTPQYARRATRAILSCWAAESRIDDALTIVSELVTNAVMHVRGATGFGFELLLNSGLLRISLADASATRPLLRDAPDHRTGGRGLRIVDALADRWGVQDHAGGKRVWAELRLPSELARPRQKAPVTG